MKYSCNLIRDILPLYHDEVASEDSKCAVEEHLKECSECKDYYKKMCGSDKIEAAAYDEELALKAAASYKKVYKKIIKIIISIVLGIIGLAILLWAVVVGYVKISAQESKEIYKDVSEYASYRSGENQIDNFKLVEAADWIFPEEITEDMDVQDFFMLYYNPWDANYLGYLSVQYDKTGYETEAARLAEYSSTDYIGYYGATGFASYEVLAMNASDSGFVYAITDGESTIIYVEMVFPGYGMDIRYEKYIPQEYLPEGLDATEDNPTRQAVLEKRNF